MVTVYQAMINQSRHSPDSKRRRQTFVETENLHGDGRRSFWKERINFVEA